MPSPDATSVPIAVNGVGDSDALRGLQFNEPLSWRAGKSIPVADLLRRLQALSNEMRDMEQEENDHDSFTRVAKELASPNLLAHKDKGVRAWTACCLVDILRLCAPDAPYTGHQLKDIFNMLISSILLALKDLSNAYNQQHLYVLNSLAEVKSIVLLTDIPDSDKLTINLFTSFFDILAGANSSSTEERIGKTVEIHMTQILIIMVDESASLPQEVIDVIVAQFLRIDPNVADSNFPKSKKNGQQMDEKQSRLAIKELPPAYNMAKTVCNNCSDRMSRHISQYFNDIIVDASSAAKERGSAKRRRISEEIDNADVDLSFGPTDEDLRDLRKAHQLLRELWRACPNVLQNVIPQLEAELSAENAHLRLLATEAFGDIVSGIGAAGCPTPTTLNPLTYPYVALFDTRDPITEQNVLMRPLSPQPFAQVYPHAYNSFHSRCNDKSPIIRAAWTTGICRILRTAAGGVGLSQEEEGRLIKGLTRMLGDADEKVRLSALRAVGTFSLRDVILKISSSGNIDTPGSTLAIMAERMRDRKHVVRTEAMKVLSRLWGAAAGNLLLGDESVSLALGSIPSKILGTYFTNDHDIHMLIDQVIFENMLPLTFPPLKTAKSVILTNGNTSISKESQGGLDPEISDFNPDKIRTERILLFAKDLDERARQVFYALQHRQLRLVKVVGMYLKLCEDYNGGVMERKEDEIKAHLSRLIQNLAAGFTDPSKLSIHLWKFAKMHDRRAYQLIRFCMAPESDYRTMYKAIREFIKRMEQSTTAPQDLMNSLLPLLYRVASIIYNRSHVPAIMEFSRGEGGALTATAHEMLRDISTQTPEVLKAQVQGICKYLQDEAPSNDKSNDGAALDNLKACASFAKRFAEEIPKDRQFVSAMTAFALYGRPASVAKHAVTVIVTASDKKELRAEELVQKCLRGFEYGTQGFLSRLAALSQLMLLAPEQTDPHSDAISEIAIEQILLQSRAPSQDPTETYTWSDANDEECEAKCWALKILVNRVRAHNDPETLSEIATPVYDTLNRLVKNQGELLPSEKTPPVHKSRLRLQAARLSLKLCLKKSTDALLTPAMFNDLSLTVHDPLPPVRISFLKQLKKHIGATRLPQRFFAIPFLFAYEPTTSLRSEVLTWLRSRTNYFHSLQGESQNPKATILMESVFARLISLLAHHPDYSAESADLVIFARYVVYYLQAVASEENLSLIFHIAQRVKQSHDAITPSPETDENLYHLSDLAQLTIRKYEEANHWTIQTQPGKASLPKSLFAEIKDHEEAQDIAEKNFLLDDVEERVEDLVTKTLRSAKTQSRKRKSETEAPDHEGRETKKGKSLPIRKGQGNRDKKPTRTTNGVSKATKKPKAAKKTTDDGTPTERRRSGRVRGGEGLLKERDSDEDDEEMMNGVAEWTYTMNNGKEADVKDDESEGNEADVPEEADEDGKDVDEWEAPASPSPRRPIKAKKLGSTGKGARARGKQ